MKKLLFLTCLLAFAANCLFAANEAIKPEGEGTAEYPYVLTRIENLVWMDNNMKSCNSSVFCLGNDIDASETQSWENQFIPIGTTKETWGQNINFGGTLDGKNFSIKNLHIRSYGMFSGISGAKIQNLFLDNFNGKYGALAQICTSSVITNVHVSGTIKGGSHTGGICGSINNCQLVNCSFIGFIYGIGTGGFGGIVGRSEFSDISYCKVSGYINSSDATADIGGICGIAYGNDDGWSEYYSRIRYCIADVKIAAEGNVGGIVGQNLIENVEQYPGEDPYVLEKLGLIDNYSLCVADTSSAASAGGICASFVENSANINNFYDKTGIEGTAFGKGVSSENMKRKLFFTNWDFTKIWSIQEGETTPYWKICNDKPFRVVCLPNFPGTISVTPDEKSYALNENVTIDATAPENGAFWGFQGDLDNTDTSVSVSLKRDLVVKAEFVKYICNAEDFLKIGRDQEYPKGGHYIQTANIDMSGIDCPAPKDFWGVYDGNHHVIRNIVFKEQPLNIGLFANVREALICNLGIIDFEKDASDQYNQYFGVLGCEVYGSEISNCYVRSEVNLPNSGYVGGLCSGFGNSKMIRCEFQGNIPYAPSMFGGLVHSAVNSHFEDCSVELYGKSNTRKDNTSGLAISVINSIFANCYVKGDGFGHAFTAPDRYFDFVFSNCYAFAESECSLEKAGYVNCYFNSNCVERAEWASGFVSPEEMKQQETYVGWDFENVWDIEEGVGTPYFRYALPEPIAMFALLLLALMAVRKR